MKYFLQTLDTMYIKIMFEKIYSIYYNKNEEHIFFCCQKLCFVKNIQANYFDSGEAK